MATDFWDVQEIVREAKAEERAAIVAYLRAEAAAFVTKWVGDVGEAQVLRSRAGRIEHGEHVAKRVDGGENG